MCTSFVWRKNGSVIAAMNFDNNGMPFNLNLKNSKQFVVLVDGGYGKWPSFGVNSSGMFVNNLIVDSNGKGLYKRANNKVTHTSKLVGDILSGAILPGEIGAYLERIEVVNGPKFSVHNMISDMDGNVWVVEPGRGNIYSAAKESPYYIMTNFSLCDYYSSKELRGCGADRYETAKKILDETDNLDIVKAFEVLSAVNQNNEWKTVFSMVCSQNEKAVYFCYNSDFSNIQKFSFI